MPAHRHRPPALDAIGPPRASSHRASFDARLVPASPGPATPASSASAASRAHSCRSFLGGFSDVRRLVVFPIGAFATLLRSHRASARKAAQFQPPDITSSEFFSEYAGRPALDQHSTMDRTSREQKTGNKVAITLPIKAGTARAETNTHARRKASLPHPLPTAVLYDDGHQHYRHSRHPQGKKDAPAYPGTCRSVLIVETNHTETFGSTPEAAQPFWDTPFAEEHFAIEVAIEAK
ncbi:hypothetical protein HYPSUDRAFT_196216 [Hypholoma sublateritium FD-334 SS-4]|uniref:Uncharacterized protein n=1 Tax=Hypholoma sublateritium (strain FD-334 SS-4) TaxID=945553 RepID=A0A0D2QE75_HYPSF|nr:hypothetical protein HYPSUDRAFT_196216 [Hypholoma sublateritium FD-334 SS-4]